MAKAWDDHVVEAEELARTEGFLGLRDEIIRRAEPRPDDVVMDIGAGTGLLTLAVAPLVAKVWAIDVSGAMIDYLTTKAASGELDNVEAATATAISLPLVDEAASLVVSNYCYHHLSDPDKERGLAEAFRVLHPDGRLVIGDMLFKVDVADPRSRRVLAGKVRAIVSRGPAGLLPYSRTPCASSPADGSTRPMPNGGAGRFSGRAFAKSTWTCWSTRAGSSAPAGRSPVPRRHERMRGWVPRAPRPERITGH
jgi:SAM-dependent methyltransferase